MYARLSVRDGIRINSYQKRKHGTMKEYPLTVLSALRSDELIAAFFKWRETDDESSFADFLRLLYLRGAQDDFSKYVYDAVLYDENPFSVACAAKKTPSPYVEKAFLRDMETLRKLICTADPHGMFAVGNELSPERTTREHAEKLHDFYARYGYGDFIRYRAFRFDDGALRPIESPSPIQLSDLKNYEEEKKTVAQNIENFLEGLPHSNMLLYGERGTGKSSTVHAMINRYYENGLRLVELSKENMLVLSRLKEHLRAVPLKFIIYIDDLSLSAGDERISSLKAALEGCAEGYTDNAMIVATSNRRHIIDEKFSRREDSVHAGDSMQEELSLSDRFGICVLFSTTNKEQYLSIVRQLAADKGVSLPQAQLDLLAERWAIVKGGRSPRRAKQFVDLAYSLSSKGLPVDF